MEQNNNFPNEQSRPSIVSQTQPPDWIYVNRCGRGAEKLSTTIVVSLVAGLVNDMMILYCFFQGLPTIIAPPYAGAIAAAFTGLVFFLTVSSAVGIVFAGYAISTVKKIRKQQIPKPGGLRILGYSSIVINFVPLLLFVILVGVFVATCS